LLFCHRLEKNRELAIRDRTLEIEWWHGNDNNNAFMTMFNDKISKFFDNNSGDVPSTASLPGNQGKVMTATYDIPVEEYENFVDAYVAALEAAFTDFAVAHRELIRFIDEAFEESLDAYR